MINLLKKISVFIIIIFLIVKNTAAQDFDPTKNFVEQQQRIDNSLATAPLPEVKLQVNSVQTLDQLPEIEQNCVVLNQLSSEVLGADVKSGVKAKLDRALSSLLKPKTGVIGRCIGSTGIGYILSQVQSNLIEAGYITTRVDLPDQDFAQSGELVIRFIPGLIGEVKYDQDSASDFRLTLKPVIHNSVTFERGDLLDVKALENSLENYRRLGTTQVTVGIKPSETVQSSSVGYSDIVISWQQRVPVSGVLTIDDAGNLSSGRYQTALQLSFDNMLGLNDELSVYANTDLPWLDDGPTESLGLNFNYALPYKNSLIALSYGQYDFDETLLGLNNKVIYSGQSKNFGVDIKQLVLRSQRSKTYLSIGAFHKRSNNFLDEEEVEVQRRKTSGWTLGASHLSYLDAGYLTAGLNYSKGTGALGAIDAPEEEFGEGVSRPAIWEANTQYVSSFLAGELPLSYSIKLRGQYADDPLIPQDRFLIGGRYSVRGVDESLSGERGLYVQQELSMPLDTSVPAQGYVGLDYGLIGGRSLKGRLGEDKQILSAVVGARANYERYFADVFMGHGLITPDYFSDQFTLGFSAGASFN